jgi:hypothetical protein
MFRSQSNLCLRGIIVIATMMLGSGATFQANAKPLVFIVSCHNVDYAKVACDQVLSSEPDAVKDAREHQKYGWGDVGDMTKYILAGAAECKSVPDTRELGRRLESDLIDALAVEPICAGVAVIREPHQNWEEAAFAQYLESSYPLQVQKAYWDLHLDYNPGVKVFGWTLLPNKAGRKPDGPMVNGEGTASKAANQICIVVSGRGATIR